MEQSRSFLRLPGGGHEEYLLSDICELDSLFEVTVDNAVVYFGNSISALRARFKAWLTLSMLMKIGRGRIHVDTLKFS